MIQRSELINGSEYWYCNLFIGEFGAINSYFTTKPVKVTYKQYNGYSDLGEFVTESGRIHLIVDIKIEGLFDNESDCINYWNSQIQNAAKNVDKQLQDLTKVYNTKLKTLTNRKIKILKELL